MTPAEYMAALMQGTAQAPGAGWLGGAQSAQPTGKGGAPGAPAGPGATTPPPTPNATPASPNSAAPGDLNPAHNLMAFMQASGQGNKDWSLDDQLTFAKQYDPTATISRGGDNNGRVAGDDRLQYDTSKLPQAPSGFTQNFTLDQGMPGIAGAGATLAPRVGGTNANSIYDKQLGWLTPTSDLGSIDEKINRAQQRQEGGLFSQIGNMIISDDKPLQSLAMWMLSAGLTPALTSAMGGGLQGALGASAVKMVPGAVMSGGKSLVDPNSYAGMLGSLLGGATGLPGWAAGGLSSAALGAATQKR